MRIDLLKKTILGYLSHLKNSNWIIDEAYKFEFANYIQKNVNFDSQDDEEILKILLRSQKIKYDKSVGIQFIQKSGRKTLKTFITQKDVSLMRDFKSKSFETVDWAERTMSYTALSAWLSSLFPEKIFPVPTTGFHITINYFFETDLQKFPKNGFNYVSACQEFMKMTEEELKRYPFEDIHLKVWNVFFKNNPTLNIRPKEKFDKVDWNWLTQDFHLFTYREVLNLYKKKKVVFDVKKIDFEPIAIEGHSKLANHMRYERNLSLVKKIKEMALKSNPMLNCEVCGFSFYEKYGELGSGFIEAHHKKPLSKTKITKTTKDDIALVCSNCHRMLHRLISNSDSELLPSIEELKSIINKK